MYCAKCGSPMPDNAKFCGRCGAPQQAAGKRCPACGKPAEADLLYCPECGSRLDAPAQAPAPAPVPMPAPMPVPAPAQPEAAPQGKAVYTVNYQVSSLVAIAGRLHMEAGQLRFKPLVSFSGNTVVMPYADIQRTGVVGVIGNLVEVTLRNGGQYRFRLNPWEIQPILRQLDAARAAQR